MSAVSGAKRAALVYHAGALGDFVLSLPALHRLSAARPELEWHYWGPRERLALLPGWSPAPAQLLREEASLWGRRPALVAGRWLAAAARVVAFAARPPPWLSMAPSGLFVQSFPGPGERSPAWVPLFQRCQLDRAGAPRPSDLWLPCWRERVLPPASGGSLVLHPGSGDPAKNLPLSVWRAAVETLCGETGLAPLVLQGPVERERGAGLGDWQVERCACATLPELIDTLARAELVLGNDSGVVHLAAVLGLPTVVAFGPSDPGVWRPLGPRVVVVAPALTCAPCRAGPPGCCEHRSCLDRHSPERLAAAGRKLLVPRR